MLTMSAPQLALISFQRNGFLRIRSIVRVTLSTSNRVDWYKAKAAPLAKALQDLVFLLRVELALDLSR